MVALDIKPVALLGLGLLVALGGCTRTSNINQGPVIVSPREPATPLQPAPSTPVESGNLSPTPPPANEQPQTAQPTPDTLAEPAQPETQVAAAEPQNARPVSREAMVGAWTVSTQGSNCQIFLALTKWSGGYRAASRGCSAAAIADVQAWDVKGNQVVLVNSSGSTAATLYSSGGERYDGSTSGGSAISFSR